VRTEAEEALSLTLRQPRPERFPLIFTSKMELMEAAVGFVHEHAVLRACTPDTVQTYRRFFSMGLTPSRRWDCLERCRCERLGFVSRSDAQEGKLSHAQGVQHSNSQPPRARCASILCVGRAQRLAPRVFSDLSGSRRHCAAPQLGRPASPISELLRLEVRNVMPRGSELEDATYRSIDGNSAVEPCLYPTTATIFPYYLAILIQAAGNPHAIAELPTDCLQPIPLLKDHELLVWTKGRTTRQQRRAFRSEDPFEPPALVRDLIEWTFFKAAKHSFSERRHLPPFDLSAIRPSVLTAIYRVSGDLREV